MFRKILLAYDGSEGANRALEVGIDLAKIHGAELWAVAVQENCPASAVPSMKSRKKSSLPMTNMASCWRPLK